MLIHREDEDEPIKADPDQIELEDEDPYLSQDEVDDVVSKRVSRAKRTTRKELKSDDEFWEEAAAERGIELRDDGKPKGSISDDEVEEVTRTASKGDSLEEEVSS
jgi:hypothetical protein